MKSLSELGLTQEQAEQYARRNLCSCGGRLTLAWGGTWGMNDWVIRCSGDVDHDKFTSHNQKYEKELRRVYGMKSTELMAMGKQEMLIRVGIAKFPKDLTVPEKELLAQAAITYGLDPIMGEITIYQGRPYISVDGRFRKAQEDPNFDGIESRPANKQERIDYQMPDGDYFFRGDVYVKNISRPFTGWGRVRLAEINAKGDFRPIDTNPQRMAEKRAEIQALRKAFHIPLPSIEDIGTPEADNGRVTVTVDEKTSEIKDSPPASTPETTGQQKAEPPTDLATLEFKNAGEFYTAAFEHFPQLKTQAQVNKEISLYDLSIPGQRKQAWIQLVGTYRKKSA